MEVHIDSFASTGKGVATIKVDNFNRPVFVSGGIPGDVCEIEFTKKHKKYSEAIIKHLIKESPHRRSSPCKSFGVCGGCDWLNIDYSFQLDSKKQILSFLFSKLNLNPEITIVPCDENIHYRDKSRIQFKDGRAHFYKKQSNDLVAPDSCFIINNNFNEFFGKKTKFSDGEYTFVFDYENNKVLFDNDSRPSYKYNDIIFNFGMKSFIQSNLKQNKKLIDLIISLVPTGKVLELYCGMGNFSLPLAKNGCKVVAVEGNQEAINLLKSNMDLNNISSIKPVCLDVRDFLKDDIKAFDVVLLDPPRTGVDDIGSLEKIAKITKTIVYIGCDPNSLIKDLKTLLAKGFTLEKTFIVDLFPQTHHFETIVLLRK